MQQRSATLFASRGNGELMQVTSLFDNLLLVAKRVDRVELRGLSCRIDAEEETDADGE